MLSCLRVIGGDPCLASPLRDVILSTYLYNVCISIFFCQCASGVLLKRSGVLRLTGWSSSALNVPNKAAVRSPSFLAAMLSIEGQPTPSTSLCGNQWVASWWAHLSQEVERVGW